MISQISFANNDTSVPRYNSIESIVSNIQANTMTCEKITESYISRILEEDMLYNSIHPPLNTIAFLNPNAIEQARLLDVHFQTTKTLKGKLHCVPVLLKDNIHTIEMPTQVGSYAMKNAWPPFNATLVTKLKDEGAVILAKTAMAEFAMPPADTNSLIGVTGNAYDPSLTPGGSSSGVASGIARGFGVIGIGSDNSGSIRGPAGLNGLLGLRPTYGMISSAGTFPLGELNGVYGPITYDIKDLITVLNIISGEDISDFRTKNKSPYSLDINKLIKLNLRNKRIGILRSFKEINDDGTLSSRNIKYEYDPESKEIFNTVINRLKSLGIEIVDNIDLGDFNTDNSDLLVGGVMHFDDYLRQGFAPRSNFSDFCSSDRSDRLGNNKECMDRISLDPGIDSIMYKEKRAMFERNKKILEEIMDSKKLDALFYLIQKPYYPEHEFSKEHFTFIASNAGAPAINIRGPMSKHKLPRPTLFQLLAKKHNEEVLISIIAQYEAKWKPSRPKIEILNQGKTFDDITSFNAYKQKLSPALYHYMLQNNLTTDTLSREKWLEFLTLNE